MTTATYIMKNYHQHETPAFCIYDAEFNFIEEVSLPYRDAMQLGLKSVSPMQVYNATRRTMGVLCNA